MLDDREIGSDNVMYGSGICDYLANAPSLSHSLTSHSRRCGRSQYSWRWLGLSTSRRGRGRTSGGQRCRSCLQDRRRS